MALCAGRSDLPIGKIRTGEYDEIVTAVTPASAYDAAELVGRMRSGDASALRDVVDQYEPLLRNHRLSAEDADDAVQLTWLHCLEHIDQLTYPNKLRAWPITRAVPKLVHSR